MPQPNDELLTLGLAAVRIGGGVQHHPDRPAHLAKIRYFRAGRFRSVPVSDLDAIRAACRGADDYRDSVEVSANA